MSWAQFIDFITHIDNLYVLAIQKSENTIYIQPRFIKIRIIYFTINEMWILYWILLTCLHKKNRYESMIGNFYAETHTRTYIWEVCIEISTHK